MMKQIVTVIALLLCAAAPSFAGFEGPLQVKNQFPPFLFIDQPYLEPARTETSVSLGLSHSSVYVIEDTPQWSFHTDLELTELVLRFKKDFPGLFEAGIDVPVERAIGGFLDGPLATYHETFGFGDYGRKDRPKNDFLYTIKRNGSPVIEGDDHRTAFGDVRLTLKKKIVEGPTTVSVLLNCELPTGNARVGYGSGSYDASAALLLDQDIGAETRLSANIGAVLPGDLKAYQTVALQNFFYAGLALEYLSDQDLAFIAQLIGQTSPYPHTGVRQIDTPGLLLVLGGRYRTSSGSYELSLTEDPNTSGAPDFILNLTYRHRW